jgi:hypothetical protein
VLEGRARTDGASDRTLMNIVTPGYFSTMGIGMVSGRDFADLRDVAAPPQVVVNEAFVRQYAVGFDPLGRRVTVRKRIYTIAGVVRDSLYNAFGEPPTPFIYFSQRDNPSPSMEIHTRVRSGPETGIAATVRDAVHQLDPSLPLYNVRSLDAHVESNLVFQRIPARMFVVLGPLLLGLAALGIYAVVSYGVAQRIPEIGTRIALGATAGRVTRMLVGETMQVVVFGMAGGAVIALLVGSGVLLRDGASAAVVAGIVFVFLLVALGASIVPARRASQVDPIRALKTE